MARRILRHSRPLRLQTKERRDLIPQNAAAQTLEICCGDRSESRNLRGRGRRYCEPCSFIDCAPARHARAKAIQVLKASLRRLREIGNRVRRAFPGTSVPGFEVP